MNLTVARPALQAKYNKFLELHKDLQRCEPRVVSLQEAADQLELQAESPACRQVRQAAGRYTGTVPTLQVKVKLAVLSRSLACLVQVCGLYLASLAARLDLPPPDLGRAPLHDSQFELSDSGLPTLTDRVGSRQRH